MLNATSKANILWSLERIVTQIFIPLLANRCFGNKNTHQPSHLSYKVRKELLPCLRSFCRLCYIDKVWS